MVTDAGEKKNPPLPTVTVTVIAFAAVGQKAKNRAAITDAIARTDEVFIGSSHLVLSIIAHVHRGVQWRKGDRIVTLPSSF